MLESVLRLVLAPEIGPALAHRLLAVFDHAAEVFTASVPDLMEVDGVSQSRARSLLDPKLEDRVETELKACEREGVTLIPFGSPDYPANLASTATPPLILWVKGRLRSEDALALAVVGPRKPSEYARQMTQALVPPLCARGLTIISGMASGIDTEGHLAALDCGGRTLAMPGQGLGVRLYPSGNQKMARRIIEEDRGALVSIFPMATEPFPGLFPQRNAVIAGMSLGVLIIEAGEKSGTLITAGHAAEFGRPVLACPGDATRPNARGSNRLIADGAALVQSSDDVLQALAPDLRNARNLISLEVPDAATVQNHAEDDARRGKTRSSPPSDPLARRIIELLETEHRMIDHLLDTLCAEGFAQSRIVQILLELELSGVIRQLPGRVYTLGVRP